MPIPLLLVGAGAAAVLLVLFLALATLWLWRELSKPPPAGGSPYVLPNGLTITHWQAAETDFLFEEIWGSETAYARGGLVFRPGAVILDAGANIGMFSLFAAARCGGAARIIAFEPIPSTHAVLKANADAANAGAHAKVFGGARVAIEALNVGLSDAPADAVFHHHPHFSVWSTADGGFAEARLARIEADMPRALSSNPSALVRACFPRALARALAGAVLQRKMGKTEAVRVRLETLSSIIDARDLGSVIDFLKVDVEGAELRVLAGIRDEHWARIQQVALEVENFATKDVIVEKLREHGFKTSWFASERERNPGVESEVSMVYGVREA